MTLSRTFDWLELLLYAGMTAFAIVAQSGHGSYVLCCIVSFIGGYLTGGAVAQIRHPADR